MSLTQSQQGVLFEWHTALEKALTTQPVVSVSEAWIPVVARAIKKGVPDFEAAHAMFLRGDFHNFGAQANHICRELKTKPSLILADSNYGDYGKGFDDSAWQEQDFSNTVTFAMDATGGDLTGVVLVWFVSDKQLLDALSAAKQHDLTWRVKTWVKPRQPSPGQSFRNDTELIIILWKDEIDGRGKSKGESSAVRYINPDDPNRYGVAIHVCARLLSPPCMCQSLSGD